VTRPIPPGAPRARLRCATSAPAADRGSRLRRKGPTRITPIASPVTRPPRSARNARGTEWKDHEDGGSDGGADRHADKGAEPMMAAASLKRSARAGSVANLSSSAATAAPPCCRWRSRRRQRRWSDGRLTASAPTTRQASTPPQNEDGHERFAGRRQIGVTWPCTSASLKLRAAGNP